MITKYLAVPLLVYIPEDHPFSNRGHEYIESSLIDQLQLIGVEPLIAEDFQSISIETNSHDQENSACISKVCPPIKPQPITNPGFDPNRNFDSPSQAVEYCLSFPQPIAALANLVAFSIMVNELGFAAETIQAFPDGPIPEH